MNEYPIKDLKEEIDNILPLKLFPFKHPERQKRNEKCKCGSGKKFKKCCHPNAKDKK
jgi:uncharacterized protein YecA (UPF0149 family)